MTPRCSNKTVFLSVTLIATLVLKKCICHYTEVPREIFIIPGDVYIGVIASSRSFDGRGDRCGTKVLNLRTMQRVESFAYAVDKINNDPNILPNVKLGMILLDDCFKESVALIRALQLIGRLKLSTNIPDVLSVIGPMSSQRSIQVATLLRGWTMPQVSPTASIDILSNKQKFPYFFRTCPPDQQQISTMVDVLVHFDWKYISVLYRDDDYGHNGFKRLQQQTEKMGICIAFSAEVSSVKGVTNYTNIVESLVDNSDAKVVIVYSTSAHTRSLLNNMIRLGIKKRFIWILSESGGNIYRAQYEHALGAFHMLPFSRSDGEFDAYFKSLTPASNLRNPWFKMFWQRQFRCSFDATASRDKCTMNETYYQRAKHSYATHPSISLGTDAVFAIATALHNYIRTSCNVSSSELHNCLERKSMVEFLKNVSFDGTSQGMEFDHNGNIVTKYMVRQWQRDDVEPEHEYTWKTVGAWDKHNDNLIFNESEVVWYSDRGAILSSVPESVCSRDCMPGYVKVAVKYRPCCWACRKCRENEIHDQMQHHCNVCPVYEWPNQTSFLTCERIEAYYLRSTDISSIILITLASLGVFASIFTIVFYRINWQHKLIKATSKELSMIILSGTTFACVGVFILLSYPDVISCYLGTILFHVSASLTYIPMTVKTSRVYRIFIGAKKGVQKPRCISTRSVMLIAVALLICQITVVFVTTLLIPPVPALLMRILTTRFVELHCQQELIGTMIPFSLNFVAILVCAFYGFKARNLPENFNESRFIFFSIFSALILWVAFMPSYITTFYDYHKTILRCMSLILNSYITLGCLFAPKLYAVYYVSPLRQLTVQGTEHLRNMMNIDELVSPNETRETACG